MRRAIGRPRKGKVEEEGLARRSLLARGIAAPRRVFNWPARARQPAPPHHAQPELDPSRAAWPATACAVNGSSLCVLFLGSAVVYGAIVGGQTARIYDALTGGIEHLAMVSGFGVEADHRRRPAARDRRSDHRGARRRPRHHDARFRYRRRQGAPRGRSLDQARASHAAAALDPPSRRRGAGAFAVWQNKGQTYVVDAEGVVLAPALREAYAELASGRGRGRGEGRRRTCTMQLSPLWRSQAEDRRRDQGRRPALDAAARLRARDHAARRQCRRGAHLARQAR